MSFRPSKLDGFNSTSTPLLADAEFLGTFVNALKYASMSVIVNTDQRGSLLVEQSSDSVNIDYIIQKTLVVSAATSKADGAFTIPINSQYFRIRYKNGPVNQTHFRMQTVIQAVPLIPENAPIIDGNNTTNVLLGAADTFIGEFTETTKFAEFVLLFSKDTACSCTLHMDLSMDGVIVNRTKTVFYDVGTNGGVHTLVVVSRFMRVRVLCGPQAMTTFQLQVALHPQKSKNLTSTMNQQVSVRDDVTLVRDVTIPEWDIAREFFSGRASYSIAGVNKDVSTSAFEDIWPNGGNYPFQLAASILEVSSSDSNDHPTQGGCHAVQVIGLDANGESIMETVVLNGTTKVNTTLSYLRINRLFIVQVGTRGGANMGDITLQVVGGGDTLAKITGLEIDGTSTYGIGESVSGVFTVPKGKVIYLTQATINVADNKFADIQLYQVGGCTTSVAPFSPRRVLLHASRLIGTIVVPFKTFIRVTELTDIFFRGKAKSTETKVEIKAHFYMADATAAGT